jgi:hypothetical protein
MKFWINCRHMSWLNYSCKVLQALDFLARRDYFLVLHSAHFDDLVGQAPWPAADPLVGHLRRVHSSLWLRLCCMVGQADSLPATKTAHDERFSLQFLLILKKLHFPKPLIGAALLCASVAPAQMSVSGNLPVTTLDTAPAAASITALNGAATVTLAGQTSAAIVLTGTWTATLTPELSFDGGATWVATSLYQPNLGQIVPTTAANGSYTILSSGGESHARVRASAFTSGTITAGLRATARRPIPMVATGSDGANIHSLLTDTSGRLVLAGSSGTNITAATTTTVKGSAGILRRMLIATGVASATVKLFNVASGSCSGTPGSGAAGVITLPATLSNPFSLEFNQTFSAGICVVTSGATNLTVIFD